MFIDLTGRSKNKTYNTIGQPYKKEYEAYRLYQQQNYGLPLRPQRTVVQFNSTYMELVDRWESERGEITHIQGIASLLGTVGCAVGVSITFLVYSDDGLSLALLGIFISTVICFGILWFVIQLLSRELFSNTF